MASNLADLYKKEMIRESMRDPKNITDPGLQTILQAQFQTPNMLGPIAAFMGQWGQNANIGQSRKSRYGNLEQLYQAEMQKEQQQTAQEDQLVMQSVLEMSDFVEQNPDMPKDQLQMGVYKIGTKYLGSKVKDYFPNISMSGPAAEGKKKSDVEDLFSGLDSSKDGSGTPAAVGKKEDPYEIGAQYKDAEGRTAEYMGGGKWRML